MQSHTQHLLAAHAVLYGSPKRFLKLYHALGDHFNLEKISKHTLKTCRISQDDYQKMLSYLEYPLTKQTLTWLQEPGHYLVDLNHPLYPNLLKEIPDPPPVLFVIGDPTLLTTPQIAVVGSRRPSPYGHRQTNHLVKDISLLGLTITSGLACGIDTFAHECTLKHDGKAIGVIGCGLDIIYPKSNRKLYQKMKSHGCIISEYPLGTAPIAAHFPQRNRLISGLSLGTLVVEARLKSGSLITAKLALDQNKEVFAVPGLSHQKESEGCHYLIKNGAKLVDQCADIIVELPTWLNLLDKKTIYNKSTSSLQTNLVVQTLSQEAQTLIKQLKASGAMTYDECLIACQFSVQTFAKAQLECELLNLISYARGRYWPKD
jgi:DNA protecting protein DprA